MDNQDNQATPKPLGIERTGYGEGFTKEEALQNWLDTDEVFVTAGGVAGEEPVRWGRQALDPTKEIEFKCTREPYVPQRCKTAITKQHGSRQWATKHVVYNVDGDMLDSGDTKADAIKLARSLALKHDTQMQVKVEKKLTQGAAIEAVITPKTKRPGRWKFRASFLY
ncbi:MAG: hypothetical protein ACXABY_02865 [Candidatus Thorarchaeota archaeon]|jgi:hypothetical protein